MFVSLAGFYQIHIQFILFGHMHMHAELNDGVRKIKKSYLNCAVFNELTYQVDRV